MNEEGRKTLASWPISESLLGICLEILRENIKI
jgi:hypothetical protein